ncbi:TonB-dependent receptor domain-containing protein, partial [Enterobacter hormaechei]
DITKRLSLTVSARYNIADLRLRDQRGSLLDGDHRFTRFNPGVGATWRFLDSTTAYINYAETNRVPTAAELSCADPE